MGKFKEGHSKVGGRKKGGTNLISRDIKEVLQSLLDMTTDAQLKTLHEKIVGSPMLYLKFLQIIAPKSVEIGNIEPIKIIIGKEKIE